MTTKKALKKEIEALKAELKAEKAKRESAECFGNIRFGETTILKAELAAEKANNEALNAQIRQLEAGLAAVKGVEAARIYFTMHNANVTEMEV